MAKYSFPYLPQPKKDPKTGKIIGEVYYPIIPVRICYKHQFLKNPINALVDSGATRSLFPAFFGEKIKIKIKKGLPQIIRGIGGVKIKAFRHKLKIFVFGQNSFSLNTEIDFSYNQEIPLLGRIKFFDQFKRVTFKEKEKIIELEK